MSTLWDHIVTQLRHAIPEGSRAEILGQTTGYLTQRGDFSIQSPNRLALLTLEQDYGALVEDYARRYGFDGAVTYTVVSHVGQVVPLQEDRVAQRYVEGQLSFFDASEHSVDTTAAQQRTASAAFQAQRGEAIPFYPPRGAEQHAEAPHATRPASTATGVTFTPEHWAAKLQESGVTIDRDLSSWIHGDENLFTHGAAMAMATADVHMGHMLYLQGHAGMGKTHLLQAIGVTALRHRPDLRVRYLRGEDFVNGYIDAVKTRTMEAFRRHTREQVDLLLLDDVDFLGGKERCQEEFRQTLDALLSAQRWVVVTSSVARQDLQQFDARLRNRMTTGLSVSIDAPSLASRRDILQDAAQNSGVHVPADVLDLFVRAVRCNTRELLAHFSRIVSYARFTGRRLSVEVARQQLEKSYRDEPVRITIEEIVERTVEFYHLQPKEIIGRGRTKRVVGPRKVAMYLGRQWTDLSFPELGRFFDHRDHTTVLDATQSITQQLVVDPALKLAIETIERRLGVAR